MAVQIAPMRKVEDWILYETPERKLRRWRADLACGHYKTVYGYEAFGGGIFTAESLPCFKCPPEEAANG